MSVLGDMSLHVSEYQEEKERHVVSQPVLTTYLKIKEFRGTFWNMLEDLERTLLCKHMLCSFLSLICTAAVSGFLGFQ